jgi:hypothetical protein
MSETSLGESWGINTGCNPYVVNLSYSIGMSASLIFFAVPPDPNNRTPASLKPLASSGRLDLSYTDNRALIQIVNTCSECYQSWTHR